MIPELGTVGLFAATAASLYQSFPNTTRVRKSCIISTSLLLATFGLLLLAFYHSDFSVKSVYFNSHTIKPTLYKLTAAWAHHEGSMLLWVTLLSTLSAVFALTSRLDRTTRTRIVSVQGALTTMFLCFIILTSNPFTRITPTPMNGLGFNPLLQDIRFAIHLPLLYLGYVGLSIPFSFAVVTLLQSNFNHFYALALKPWAVGAWVFLTLGISMENWWAYGELGWGSSWFWDPAKNVSLLPWLVCTALIHSLVVVEKRKTLKSWTILLSLLAFSMSLLGTFLVRSGILTSVHSFTSDFDRGLFILGMISICMLGSFSLFAIRAHKLHNHGHFHFISKETSILMQNLLIITLLTTVLIGTLYPLILEPLFQQSITVGAPYYNTVTTPIGLAILLLLIVAPHTNWRQDLPTRIMNKQWPYLALSFVITGICYMLSPTLSWITLLAIFGSLWLCISSIVQFITKRRKQPSNYAAMITSHLGFALLLLSITIYANYSQEKETVLEPKQTLNLAPYTIRFDGFKLAAQDNYLTKQAIFTLLKEQQELDTLVSEMRYYPIEDQQTTESTIYYSLFANLYLTIGESHLMKNTVVRFIYQPMINGIWLGSILIALGGILSLKKRKRYYRDLHED